VSTKKTTVLVVDDDVRYRTISYAANSNSEGGIMVGAGQRNQTWRLQTNPIGVLPS